MASYPNLSIRAIRAFVTVVEQGSIAGAARELRVASSALAALIDQVEAEIGTKLLVRTRARGVAPTQQALTLAAQFRSLLDDLARVVSQSQSWAGELSGELTLAYYAPIAPAFLPQLFAPMMAENPSFRLSFQEGDNQAVQSALLSGAADLILFTGQDLQAGIETRPLLDLPPYALLPETHPLANRPTLQLSEIEREPLVQLDLPVARPYLRELFASHNLAPEIVARADSVEMVRSLVGAGIGVAVLNMRPKTTLSYAGQGLVTVPVAGDLPPLTLQVGYLAQRSRFAVERVIEAMLEWSQSTESNAVRIGSSGTRLTG